MASSSQKWTSACFFFVFIFFVCFYIPTNLPNNIISRSSFIFSQSEQRYEGIELNKHAVPDPDKVAHEVSSLIHKSEQNIRTRRKLGFFSCGTGNIIDDCWRCDPNWHKNRKNLTDCVIGFGNKTIGGRDGRFYVVTDPSDDDAVNPKPGTLRHAVIQVEPLWIIFKRDMVIKLKQELIMNSFKTIDGRGTNVHIADGACITIQGIRNVIIHGLHIHDCKRTGNAMVRDSPSHYGFRKMADGDAINIGSIKLDTLGKLVTCKSTLLV